MTETREAPSHNHFPCEQCGATLEFEPSAGVLKCPYCEFENALPETDEEVEELDFHEVFASLEQDEDSADIPTIVCESCGSNFQFDEHVASDDCPFCGSTVVATGGSRQQFKPKSLLPFSIEIR